MGKEMGNLREKLAHMKKNQWLVLVLAGILLLVIAIPVPGESEKKTQEVPKAEAEGGGEMELLENGWRGLWLMWKEWGGCVSCLPANQAEGRLWRRIRR